MWTSLLLILAPFQRLKLNTFPPSLVLADVEMVVAETVVAEMADVEMVAVATDAEMVVAEMAEGPIIIAMSAASETVDSAEAMIVETMAGHEMTAEASELTGKAVTNAVTIIAEMTVGTAKVAETVAEATTREATTDEKTEETVKVAVMVDAVANLVKTADIMAVQLLAERTILEVTRAERTRYTRAREPHLHDRVPVHDRQEQTLLGAEALLLVPLSERSEGYPKDSSSS